MKLFEAWYLNRAYKRIAFESMVYGSSHTQMKLRRKFDLFRFLVGPFKIVFFHPYNEICQCNWKDGPILRSLFRGKP